jgi:hypothetical protein
MWCISCNSKTVPANFLNSSTSFSNNPAEVDFGKDEMGDYHCFDHHSTSKKMNFKPTAIGLFLFISVLALCLGSCNDDDITPVTADCESDKVVDRSRGACEQILSFTPSFSMSISGGNRIIQTNSIPGHKVGLFGNAPGSLNPNAIREQSKTYTITATPIEAATFFPLLNISSVSLYSFGVLLNGVELDPIAAEPFPHTGIDEPKCKLGMESGSHQCKNRTGLQQRPRTAYRQIPLPWFAHAIFVCPERTKQYHDPGGLRSRWFPGLLQVCLFQCKRWRFCDSRDELELSPEIRHKARRWCDRTLRRV